MKQPTVILQSKVPQMCILETRAVVYKIYILLPVV